jgi:hypothetical protein
MKYRISCFIFSLLNFYFMRKSISGSKLEELMNNNKDNIELPVVTNAAFITRKHFEEFQSSLPADYDALKFCFVRFPATPPDPTKILPAGNNLTQISLIIVGTKKTDRVTWNSTGVTDVNGNLITLCVCEPGENDDDNTGVCPPKICR